MRRIGEYRYLGEYINEKRSETTTVDRRNKEARRIMNEILLAVVNSQKLKHRRAEIGIKL